MLETAEKFEFGPFVLEPGRHALSASGCLVALHSRAFDVLALLVRERARVVSQKEILEQVWGSQNVAPQNLTVQISELRKTLATYPGGERLIHTIPNKGYHFIGEVAVYRPSPEPTPQASLSPRPQAQPDPIPLPLPPPAVRRRFRLATLVWSMGILASLLTGGLASRRYLNTPAQAPRLSIAILPFRYAGPDHSQDYLANTVTDDLISDLAHIPGSMVIARETAEAVKNQSPKKIGHDLRVRYVIAGTIAYEEGLYYVTAHLIDTKTGAQVWSTSIREAQKSLSDAREFFVIHIGGALNLKLDELASLESLQDRPNNPDAIDLFFRARASLDSDDTAAGLSRAQDLLEQALKEQPDFADAGAALGWLLLRKVLESDSKRRA